MKRQTDVLFEGKLATANQAEVDNFLKSDWPIRWNDKKSREFFELTNPFVFLLYRIKNSEPYIRIECAYHALMNHVVIMNGIFNYDGATIYLPSGSKGIIARNIIHPPMEDTSDYVEEKDPKSTEH